MLTGICLQRRGEALKVNISAGEGLQDVLKSNLGPLGTIKMYILSFTFLRLPFPPSRNWN